VFEWYTPLKPMVEPIDKDSSIVKPHNLLMRRGSLEQGGPESPALNKY
jgi:hypothetical protein